MPTYERLQRDPDSLGAERRAQLCQRAPIDPPPEPAGTATATLSPPAQPPRVWDVERVTRLSFLAQAIRGRGHLVARLDPLDRRPPDDPALDPAACGVTPEDLLVLPASVVGGPVAKDAPTAGAAIEALFSLYCGTSGYDFDHIQIAEERTWLRDAVETGRYNHPLAAAAQRRLLERLTQTEAFERFLHRSLPGQKRFSIEGNDLLIPMLDALIRDAAVGGIGEVVMGMAHRGRLNVLAHVLGKPYAGILAGFHAGAQGPTSAPTEHFAHSGWTGDVKYHLGAQKTLSDGEAVRVRITLAPNPSHLEFVNPVIQGMTRALQDRRERPGMPSQRTRTAMAILIHGDASFPGQGIVAETLNLSALAGYGTGGTLHIIVNNQLVLQRHLGGGTQSVGLVDRSEDLRPQAVGAPAPVAVVDAAPGAEPVGQCPPGAAGPLDEEHGGDHPPMIVVRPASRWPVRGQQRQHAPPLLVRQIRAAACLLRGCRRLRHGQHDRASRPARRVAPLGDRLVVSPPARPGQPEREPLVRLPQRQQQPAHLRRGQRDQLAGRSRPPFLPPCSGAAAAAAARVTSR